MNQSLLMTLCAFFLAVLSCSAKFEFSDFFKKFKNSDHNNTPNFECYPAKVQTRKVGEYAGEERTFQVYNGVEMWFCWVPAGSFQMGSENGDDDEKPVREVTLTKGYWLGKYEVTQVQWEGVMGGNPSYFKGSRLPVEQVSWGDCQEYIGKLQLGGYECRLPTEAEWEYACRAGKDGLEYGYGNDEGKLSQYGWYGYGKAGAKTHPVGTKKGNAWGLHDLHGNVSEWCADGYGSYASLPVRDPQVAEKRMFYVLRLSHVLRGGCWRSRARKCRTALRAHLPPSFRRDRAGFRVAISPSH